MTDSQTRAQVAAAYKSPKWARRVEKMTDQQVVAVYLSLKRQGKI